MASFHIGDKFVSFNEFEEHLDKYCKENFVHFWKRDARLLKTMKTKYEKLSCVNEALKYYSLKMVCTSGGKFICRSTGERSSKTSKQDCQAFIRMSLSKDYEHLEVAEMQMNHNHVISESIYRHHPKARRLSPGSEQKAAELLKMKVNKKMLQSQMSEETGKVILLKDLSNILQKFNNREKEDLPSIIKILNDTYHAHVNLLEHDGELAGIFFQDTMMANSFEVYPQLMFFDGTYKLTNSRFVCYIFLIEDGNGLSEIVAVGLLLSEDEESVKWLLDSFKGRNPSWPMVEAIMSDKDFLQRSLFVQEFPRAKLLICLFHTLRTFKREVTCDKMGISPEERDIARKLLNKLCYVRTDLEYDAVYEEFLETAPESAIMYYNKNWHGIRRQWIRMMGYSGNFLNSTNNRLESINQKLKSVISCYSHLLPFIRNFFILLNSLRRERDHNVLQSVVVRPAIPFEEGSAESLYAAYLQPYPLKFVLKELKSCKKDIVYKMSNGTFVYADGGNKMLVDDDNCCCLFSNSMKLPCKHIFAVRLHLELPLFLEGLCAERWSKSHLMSTHRAFISNSAMTVTQTEQQVIAETKQVKKGKILTQSQKFKKSRIVTDSLATTLSEMCGVNFEEQLKFVEKFVRKMQTGKPFSFVDMEESADVHINSIEDIQCVQPAPLTSRPVHEDFPISRPNYDVPTNVKLSQPTYKKGPPKVLKCGHPQEVQPPSSTPRPFQENFAIPGPSHEIIANLKLPQATKRKGRPKGSQTTIIGLPKKKIAKSYTNFQSLPLLIKQRIILPWFVEHSVADNIFKNGGLVEEQYIEMRPENIPSACLHADITLIKPLLTQEAWQCVQSVIKIKRQLNVGQCVMCSQINHTQTFVNCCRCLDLYHIECANVLSQTKNWFCVNCINI